MNRSISADLIKSVSIFGVVYIHSSLLLGCNSAIREYLMLFFRFCVPCFILIWALFFEKTYAKKTKEEQFDYIKKRFIHLFTIYIIWSVLYFSLSADWQHLSPGKIFTTHFAGFGWAGQYFFIILFQLLLLYPLIRWLYNNKISRYLSCIIIALLYIAVSYYANHLPSALGKVAQRPFIYWIPYVFAGIALARNQLKKLPVIFAFAVLLIPVEGYFLKSHAIIPIVYITPITLLASILSCVYLLQSSIQIKNNNGRNLISYIGQNTMTVFVSNPLVISLLATLIPGNIFDCDTVAEKIMVPLLSACVVMAICTALSKLIEIVGLKGKIN